MSEEFQRRKLSEMEEVDTSIIAEKPWAKNLLEKSLEITRKGVLHWCKEVLKIGESEVDVNDFSAIFIKQEENLYEELIIDMEAFHDKVLFMIEEMFKEVSSLCSDLNIRIPSFDFEGVPLSELKKSLAQKLNEYKVMVEVRRKEVKELNNKQVDLCKSLGKSLRLLPESPLPSPQQVEEFRAYLEALENDRMVREEKFFQLREEIVNIVKELEYEPSLQFENELLSLNDTEVIITDYHMEQLNAMHTRLVNQLKSVKGEISELRLKIDNYWDKLEVGIVERDTFRQRYTGNSLHILAALKTELKNLEELKKQNIKRFILRQREQLKELWQKCYCAEEVQMEFNSFYSSELYNEDLFELHEIELRKWTSFYDENKIIFKLVEKHKELWENLLTLDNAENARRLKNRGGQLLKEEKERNRLKKLIPKKEETLLQEAEDYLRRHGREFLIFRKTVREHLAEMHENREKDLRMKLSAKKEQREKTPVTARSRLNLFPPSTSTMHSRLTPRNCTKRKLAATPATEHIKRLKGAIVQRVSRSALPKVNVSHSRRMSQKRELRRKRLSFPSNSSTKENKVDQSTASTDYNNFEKEISRRDQCRSTAFVLKDYNAPSTSTAPTPIKPLDPPKITITKCPK